MFPKEEFLQALNSPPTTLEPIDSTEFNCTRISKNIGDLDDLDVHTLWRITVCQFIKWYDLVNDKQVMVSYPPEQGTADVVLGLLSSVVLYVCNKDNLTPPDWVVTGLDLGVDVTILSQGTLVKEFQLNGIKAYESSIR